MNRRKVDNRIRVLIENGVALRYRTMFVIIGDKGRDQVVFLHHMLSKAAVKARPSVLWCYKKELGFSSHRKKRMKQLQKKIKAGTLDVKDDPFELFISATNIRYCYYSETHKILGNTYGMCVLQDFEALTPNLLARTVETVEGGGIVCLLLRTMNSLKQLYTLNMDVHARYRTESHQDVVGRFNERFLLSLASNPHCAVIDDQLNVLPISSHVLSIDPIPPTTKEESLTKAEVELRDLKESLEDTQPIGAIVKCTKTLDQAKGLLKFVEAVTEKTLRSTVAMTASRGRGKSAALGLAIATAVAYGYSNIFVTSPSPENLKTLFEFVFKGFDALDYQEHDDYEIIQSTNPELNKAIVRVNIFHEHRQTIQYINAGDSHKLEQAELVVIDEAAAIPLPLVKKLLGPYLVFMASTINGYEGTGRSLSLKLIEQLRRQSGVLGVRASSEAAATTGRVLREVTLSEPIRYGDGDHVEKWLHDLLCLDAATVGRITSGCPPPDQCELYYVNRDTLFCYHKASEEFLRKIMSLYVASHYKNSPNDLQLLSDAPAHHIFVLLPPVTSSQTTLPDVLCVIQVCLEGAISQGSVMKSLARGKRSSGDLIPWTLSQQFVDHEFAGLSGARIIRIATHPDYQGMGYGSRALNLLGQYYRGHVPSLSEGQSHIDPVTYIDPHQSDGKGLLKESIIPRAKLPPLLCKLSERPHESLDYMGVSYGLTKELLRFWKRAGYQPVYLRQVQNELTGEHSCIMLKSLQDSSDADWLSEYCTDFRRRFLSLLAFQFSSLPATVSLSIVYNKEQKPDTSITHDELCAMFSKFDLKRLELYSRSMAEHYMITDLLPSLAKIYFLNKINIHLSAVQSTILLGLGLQHKTVDEVQTELDLPASQVLGLHGRTVKKFVQRFNALEEGKISAQLGDKETVPLGMEPVVESLDKELAEAAVEIKKEQKKKLKTLELLDFSEYAIAGNEEEWEKATSGKSNVDIVSVPSSKKNKRLSSDAVDGTDQVLKKKRFTKEKKKHKR